MGIDGTAGVFGPWRTGNVVRMDTEERKKLIAQYKDGYVAVAEALLEDHP